MSKYRVLCLTDHDKHSKENSLYALLPAIFRHSNCQEIVVASRSAAINDPFFQDSEFEKIHGLRVADDFSYEGAKTKLHQDLVAYDTSRFDIIFLRLPRPISDFFLSSLEQHFSSCCIINKPKGIINTSSKAVLLNFTEVCPPIRFCNSIEQILSFSKEHDLVLKPLKEYGGKGLLKLSGDILNDGKKDYNARTYLSSIEAYIQDDGYLAMKYLKNVSQGDKRLIVVDGEILASSLRLPADGSWLCNVAMGGQSIKSEPDEREYEIVETINPYLKKNGILIYGADTLVNDSGQRTLSEINTLSIGGFPQAEMQTGKPIINITINKIFDYANVQLGR